MQISISLQTKMTSTREIYNSSPDSIFDNFPTTVGGMGEENKSVLSYNSGFTELINERYNNNNKQQRHSSIIDWPSPTMINNNNSNNNNNDNGNGTMITV